MKTQFAIAMCKGELTRTMVEEEIYSLPPEFTYQLGQSLLLSDSAKRNALYEVCDAEHASCNPECPVYALNGNKPVNGGEHGCKCFKDGEAMMRFILKHSHSTPNPPEPI